ncbi:cytochrome c biogenesis protein [Geobacter grbiciae]|uniref:cytochrome c biogenesis protein n=1 Tax=Geobacter grbiciae TaxID=155042 RepID=UPI001C020A9F|nr:cytochrome c biogenesis protein CcsA [Geobacter grbiciae]MBT1075392.1 cytochrome c biogenesis protein CcsA [Geobacter grbiciae]
MDVIFFWIATTLYALSSVLYLIHFIFDKKWGEKGAAALAAGGIVPHVAAVAMRWVQAGHGPYITRYEVFSSDALIAVAVFLAAGLLYRKIRVAGAIVMSGAFLMMGYGALSVDTKAAAPITFKSWWLVIHILFGKVITGAMLIAGALAVFYLLKSKRPERWPRLPDVASLDDLSYRFLSLGFCALGLMIVAGSIWANSAWGRYWGWDPIETWSLISWITVGAILHLRRLHGWRGRRMAWLTIAALLLAIFTAFLITIVSPGIHSSYMVK